MPNKLLILTPIHDGMVSYAFNMALSEVSQSPYYGGWQTMVGESDIHRARSKMASRVLQAEGLWNEIGHVLWVDADIIFTRQHFDHMASLGEAFDCIGGAYKKKQLMGSVVARDPKGKHPACPDIVEVSAVGTGFLRMSKRALEVLREGAPLVGKRLDGQPPWWYMFAGGVVDEEPGKGGDYLSEDYMACYRLAKAGIKTYLDTRCQVGHRGFHVFQ